MSAGRTLGVEVGRERIGRSLRPGDSRCRGVIRGVRGGSQRHRIVACCQGIHEHPRVAMTNSVRNSGPDSTRRREPATDTYRDPVLVSQKRATRCWVASSSGSMWSVVSKAWRNWCETRRLLCRVSTSGGKAHLDGGCRGVLPCDGGVPPCEGCREPAFGGEDGPRACRVPADGRRVVAATLTRSGSTQTSRPWDSAYHGPHGQRLAEAARAFPTLWRPSARRRSRLTSAGQEPLRWLESRTCW